MQKRPVSLKDIATVLNISVSAVSRALRDQYDVSPALRERVKEAAKSMGYRPNPHARGLINQSTNLIGVIVPDFVTHFYASIIEGIENVLSREGYYPIITSSHESYEREIETINNLLNLRVAGLVICVSQECDDYTHLHELESGSVPVVYVDRTPRSDEFFSVVSDDEMATRALTDSLIERGARRILLIAGPNYLNITSDRKRGYIQSLNSHGIDFDPQLYMETTLGHYDGEKIVDQIYAMERRADAVICMNDTILYGLIIEGKRRRLPITTDFTIAGFTDELHAGLISPELVVMTHPTYQMGISSAEKLLHIIKYGKEYTEKRDICSCSLYSD